MDDVYRLNNVLAMLSHNVEIQSEELRIRREDLSLSLSPVDDVSGLIKCIGKDSALASAVPSPAAL